MEIVQVLREKLFELEDKDYAEFQRKLIPNVAPETIIGVRTPELRKLAKEVADADERYAKLLEFITGALTGKVSKVRFSGRLTDSVSCLVSEEGAMSPHMERMFKAMNQELPPSERILELNPNHPLIAAMEKVYEQDPEAADLAAVPAQKRLLRTHNTPAAARAVSASSASDNINLCGAGR